MYQNAAKQKLDALVKEIMSTATWSFDNELEIMQAVPVL